MLSITGKQILSGLQHHRPNITQQYTETIKSMYFFHYKVAAASPTGTTFSEQTLTGESCFCQAEKERCPVRVNLCHGDETRETGGLIPDWFPL